MEGADSYCSQTKGSSLKIDILSGMPHLHVDIPFPFVTERTIVTSQEAAIATKQLLDKEGIFAGLSSGAVVHQAIKLASEMDEGNIVV
ncbi:unnamed protein product, partial [marine sediment metagenome]